MPVNQNPSRAKMRRANAEGVLPANRPGAEDHKSLAKSLSPQAQKRLQQAKELGQAGDHAGSAKVYRELGEVRDVGTRLPARRAVAAQGWQ
jgi:hypothetical protein